MAATHLNSQKRQRLNAWLTGLLVILLLVQGNRLAREHLGVVRDFTEDQLFLPSPVGKRMLSELEDTLQVKAFFTGDVKVGNFQIAKRRLIDQLQEFELASAGRMQITYVDPNESTEARREAEVLGIEPYPTSVTQGVSKVFQNVWLGLVLRYRGKESTIRFVFPQYMESTFLAALRKVTREVLPTIGFVTGDGRNLDVHFTPLRNALGEQYLLREVLDLSLGKAVPESVDVLVVAQPTNLHPRVAYAIDQFIQGGGRALFLVDDIQVDMAGRAVYRIPTGLESLFDAWGVALGDGLIFDQGAFNSIVRNQSEGQPASKLEYPFWPQVLDERLNRELPVTAPLKSANLFWAQELNWTQVAGVVCQDLLWSTDQAWSVPYDDPAIYDTAALLQLQGKLSKAGAKRRVMGLSLSGTFNSAFVGAVPGPVDPIKLALYEDRVQRAQSAGLELPLLEVELTDEVAVSAQRESQVILVGDGDWAGGKYFGEANRLLFVNLIDWLALEGDLLALRSRIPIERPIADFLAEERAAIGLVGAAEDVDEFERISMASYENQAASRAARRRWKLMAQATGGALLMALCLGSLWCLTLGRGPASGTPAGDRSKGQL